MKCFLKLCCKPPVSLIHFQLFKGNSAVKLRICQCFGTCRTKFPSILLSFGSQALDSKVPDESLPPRGRWNVTARNEKRNVNEKWILRDIGGDILTRRRARDMRKETRKPFHIPYFELCICFNCCKCTVF